MLGPYFVVFFLVSFLVLSSLTIILPRNEFFLFLMV